MLNLTMKQLDFVSANAGTMPHCDAKVLHSPGTCQYCDMRKDLQAARLIWGIAFTGEASRALTTCPSELDRTFETINRWPGNRAVRSESNSHPADGGPEEIAWE